MAKAITYLTYTGAAQTYTVPDQVTSLIVEAWGAWGGYPGTKFSGQYLGAGGAPGYVKGSVAVTPGDSLTAYVGGCGKSPGEGGAGGFNGGGKGSLGTTSNTGVKCGGGGATDLRKGGTALANRVIVAGGGGGCGYADNNRGAVGYTDFPTSPYPYSDNTSFFQQYPTSGGCFGGSSAGIVGGDGSTSRTIASSQGKGGTATAGGAAGTTGGGVAGASGQGGAAASATGGGGGGGGYYGGGSGSQGDGTYQDGGGGGGAGSSFASSSAVSAALILGPVPVTNGGGSWLDGNGEIVVTYDQPPGIPGPTITTQTTGTAGQYDQKSPIKFAWQFSSVIPYQWSTAFDIQYSADGGTTWTVISQPGAVQVQDYTFPASFFTAGTDYLVQVRVYDRENSASGWSASVAFEPVTIDGPAVITAPVGDTISATPVVVTWTTPTGLTQSKYRVQGYDPATGNSVFDSGEVTSASHTYTYSGSVYGTGQMAIRVQYLSTTGGTQWATPVEKIYIQNMYPPGTPTVSLVADSDAGHIVLGITNFINPDTSIGTAYNDIYRKDVTNSGDEIKIAANITPNSVFVDSTPASNVTYLYRVRAYSLPGGFADAT